MNERPSLLRSAGSISVATAVSRVLGLFREQVQSYYFGAGFVTDAFLAAFRIPNLLRDLFAEGTLSAAFVPTFTAIKEKEGEEVAWRLANRLLTALAAILGVVTIAIVVFAPAIMHVYAAGFTPDKLQLAITMTRILAPFLFAVALASVAIGILNTYGKFFVPALSPAVLNVAAILGVVLLTPLFTRFGITAGLSLAVGAMVGGILQFGVQLPLMRRLGFRFRPEWAPRDPGLVRIAALMIPATIGQAAVQINFLVDTWLASGFGNGPITWLSLAFRLIQLPIGLFGVALGMANLVRVSRDAATGNTEGLRANLSTALRGAALLALPATAGLIALREPIVAAIFEHGRFDHASTMNTAAALLCYAVGLYAYAITKIQVPTFYALGDARLPVLASVASVAVKLAANGAFLVALPSFGVNPFLGLALSTSVAAWTHFGILAWGLRKRAGSIAGHGVVRTTLAMAVVSLIMALCSGFAHAALTHVAPGGGFAGELTRLGVAMTLGIVIASAGALALRVPEARAFAALVSRLARPKPPA